LVLWEAKARKEGGGDKRKREKGREKKREKVRPHHVLKKINACASIIWGLNTHSCFSITADTNGLRLVLEQKNWAKK